MRCLRDVPLSLLAAACLAFGVATPASALDRPEVTFKIFQFPKDKIPRIDGNTDDWDIVPDSYAVGMDQLVDDEGRQAPDPKSLDVKVKVGWVKGESRLYFLYQAYKSYWDFSRPDLHNDIFEVVVDGDASGGPLIDSGHTDVWTEKAVGEMAAARQPALGARPALGDAWRACAELPTSSPPRWTRTGAWRGARRRGSRNFPTPMPSANTTSNRARPAS